MEGLPGLAARTGLMSAEGAVYGATYAHGQDQDILKGAGAGALWGAGGNILAEGLSAIGTQITAKLAGRSVSAEPAASPEAVDPSAFGSKTVQPPTEDGFASRAVDAAPVASHVPIPPVSTLNSSNRLPLKIERPRVLKLDIWTAPMMDAARAVQLFAREKFAGKTVLHADDGSEILIPWKSLKKSLSTGSGLISRPALAAALKLDELIASARFIKTLPDRKGRPDILNAHFYERTITMDGHEALIHVVVREHRDGRRYYDHFELKKSGDAAPATTDN